MSDPTHPADPKDQAATAPDATADTTELPAVPADPATPRTTADATAPEQPATDTGTATSTTGTTAGTTGKQPETGSGADVGEAAGTTKRADASVGTTGTTAGARGEQLGTGAGDGTAEVTAGPASEEPGTGSPVVTGLAGVTKGATGEQPGAGSAAGSAGVTAGAAGAAAGSATAAGGSVGVAGGATTGSRVATAAAAETPQAAAGEQAAADGKTGKKGLRRLRVRGPWVTVGGALVALVALALLGYIWGLGPLSRLNAERAITPPAKVAGLDRITDPEIRSQAQLDQTRDALSRINDGKKVMVEAYGSLEGDRFYVLIALRGRVDIDKVVADSGASADKVKKIGKTTCIEAAGNLPTQCYRGSNTLTVIAQSANEGVAVDQVEPVAEEAFKAMR